MCGIIGIFGNNSPKEKALASLEKITHRGSSVFELEDFPGATIGANRLPIVDRQLAKQPLKNEDGTIFAVQNGEIFNYLELQQDLKNKGHSFTTNSDTEVLVHLYEEYGEKMVEKIDSEMFAFIIFDSKKGHVYAARDPLGVKPMYYALDETGQLYFASEIKQLAFFEDIKKIQTFPPGHYFKNGKFKRYFNFKVSNKLKNEGKVLQTLEKDIVEAVKKRVQTDLPIGVLLSGGVDSSLIMEIATRFHTDVTGIVLGYPGSPDYEFALRLCKERGYKYHIVRPDVDFESELENIIYHLETYEPLIIRQSFSLDLCAKAAQRLGLRVVLVGEGADELFGGYNEFSSLPSNLINEGCRMLIESLHCGHLQRVDRMSMKHTVEIRAPFFDKKIVYTALSIDGRLKVTRKNHQLTTKYILRKVAANFLPEYIAWRYKMPFSNGAGMNVGNNFKTQDGEVAKAAIKKEAKVEESLLDKYKVTTKEGKYYLSKFKDFNFDKLVGAEKRLIVKDNLSELYASDQMRMVVAEFDRFGLYFPLYFAAEEGIFKLHKLDIDFIATGGDDRTYQSLVNNSAHIGLADPLFAMFENQEGVKGEIIGELVKKVPSIAVTINPSVKIESIDDFSMYRVGTFQEFTTTHGIARYFLPKGTKIAPFDYKELIQALINRSIDIAILLPEQAIELVSLGGKILFEFKEQAPRFLFSGFTISNILEKKYRVALKAFLTATREATRFILKDNERALKRFIELFPNIKNHQEVLDYYKGIWSSTLEVEKEDYANARRVWQKNYPELLKEYRPTFRISSPADPVMEKINNRNFKRDFPFLEDMLDKKIQTCLSQHLKLDFMSFWGAGNKKQIDKSDIATINNIKSYIDGINQVFPPKVSVTFILADEHGRNNRYEERVITSYLAQVGKELEKNGFHTVYLSGLWKKWNITQDSINKVLEKKPAGWWNEVSISKKLEERAVKRFQKENKVFGAQRYYIMRCLENAFIEKEFKNSVFFAFSDGMMQSIYPKLPTVYLYTKERGDSSLPWFSDQAGARGGL